MSPTQYVALRPVNSERLEEATEVDVDVYDVIGDFWGEGVPARSVLAKLRVAKNASQINVRINSGGGDAYDGIAIYNLLVAHKAKVVVDIDGLAASAASLIAMAGDEIRMSESALMMIHNPWTFTIGDAADLREKADQLDKLRDALANAYIQRSGLPREKVIELLDAETWFNADEAVELGFATHVTAAKQAAAMLRSEIDLSRFKRAPESLKAMAKPTDVTIDIRLPAETKAELEDITARIERATQAQLQAPPEPPKPKEKPMTTPNASIAAALGLPVGAPEEDVLRACARMRNLEVEIVAITGAQSSSAALGAVRALKEGADSAAKLKADLDKVTAERDQQNFETLVQRGEAPPVKLTPATTKLYRDRFTAATAAGRGADVVAELKGFLDVAPTIIGAPREQPTGSTGDAGAALAWNGKTYADLTGPQRHALWQQNPELWKAMSDAFNADQGRA